MFKLDVDNEIALVLIDYSMAEVFSEVATRNRDYLCQWLAWPRFCQSPQDFRLFIQRSLHDYADGKSLTCSVWYEGELVGNISFNEINDDLQRATMGYWLSESHQGKGIITRAANAMIEIGFEHLELEKIQLQAATMNLASRSVAERLGMNLEGIITRNEKIGDEYLDHAIYGLSRCEWQASQ